MVMLAYWLPCTTTNKSSYQVLDLFSGRGRISQLAAKAGLAVASYDLCMARKQDPKIGRPTKKASRPYRSVMDWNGDSGFLLFSCTPDFHKFSRKDFHESTSLVFCSPASQAGGHPLPSSASCRSRGSFGNSVFHMGCY